METPEQYPFTGYWDSCWDKIGSGKVKVTQQIKVPPKSVEQLKAAIMVSPTVVAVDGTDYPFVHYMSGIITDASCLQIAETHHVLAVGYGEEKGQGYFILKNSWGADWGEHGYLRIGTGTDGEGICGILHNSEYAATD